MNDWKFGDILKPITEIATARDDKDRVMFVVYLTDEEYSGTYEATSEGFKAVTLNLEYDGTKYGMVEEWGNQAWERADE